MLTGRMDDRRQQRAFAAILAFAISVRLLFVFILPFGQTIHFRLEGLNDEPSHYNYVRFLADEGKFPVQSASARDADAFQRNEFEYYQPPIYYLIGAGLDRLVGHPTSFYAARLLSALLGFLSLWLVWRIFMRLGLSPLVACGAVLFVALWPNHAYFTSMVSNDSLDWVLGLLLSWELADWETLLAPAAGRRALVKTARVFLLLAAGMLVKTSLFLFYPPVAAMYLWAFVKGRDRRILAWGGAAVAASLAVVSPWYLRDLRLYGSLSGIEVGNGPEQRWLFAPGQLAKFLKDATRYFWFPMQHIFPTNWRRLLQLVEFALLAGNAALLARWYLRRRRVTPVEVFFALLFLGNAVAYVQYNLHWLNSEGRFFFPSLAAMLLYFTVPLERELALRGATRWFLAIVALEAFWPYVNLLLRLGYA